MTIRDRFNHLSENSKTRVLDGLGLEPKREPTDFILPALGLFGAGVIVGAVIGLMVAPKPGADLRRDIRDRSHEVQTRINERLHRGEQQLEE